MLYPLEHLAVIFGAANWSIGRSREGDRLVRVVVLGLVTAVGGGTLRDVGS